MRSIVAALVIAAGSLLFLAGRGRSEHRIRDHPRNNRVLHHGTADHRASPSAPEHQVSVTPGIAFGRPRAKHRYQPSTKDHKWSRSDRISAVTAGATIAATIFAAFAFVAACLAVLEAHRQANTAQAALIASNRPWVKVVDLSDIKLEVMNSTVSLTVNVNVKNIGHSPAQRTFIKTKIMTDFGINDEISKAVLLCDQAASSKEHLFDRLVFPEDDDGIPEFSFITMEEIIKDKEALIQRTFERMREGNGDEIANRTKKMLSSFPISTNFVFVGCVVYDISVDEAPGQTAFIYRLDHNCGNGQIEICSFDMTKQSVYTGKEVHIRKPINGAFAR